MTKVKIYVDAPQDRDSVVMIMAKNGYTVRQGREKAGKRYIKYVEFWKEVSDGETKEIGSTA